jgi:hypothetical protein
MISQAKGGSPSLGRGCLDHLSSSSMDNLLKTPVQGIHSLDDHYISVGICLRSTANEQHVSIKVNSVMIRGGDSASTDDNHRQRQVR